MSEEIKLNDLMKKDQSKVERVTHVPVNISDITKVTKETTADKIKNVEGDIIDFGVSEKMKRFTELAEPVVEKNIENQLDGNDDGMLKSVPKVEKSEEVVEVPNKKSLKLDDKFNSLIDDDNLDEDEDNMDNELPQSVKDNIEEIKETVKNINAIKKVDLSTYKIKNTPISVAKVLRFTESNTKHIVDWILYNNKKSFSISAISGHELTNMNPYTSERNKLNSYKTIYGIIYSHIEDNNKPDFESWLKTLNYFDRDDLFFGAYKACFAGFNHIPYTCPHCAKMFIKKFVDVNEMVKYDSDKVKEEAAKILAKDTTSLSTYESDLVQISDNYVFSFKPPSVYSVIFEQSMLAEDFVEENRSLLNAISYIDTIFYIDSDSKQLIPIDMKEDENDFQKSIARKIRGHVKIFDSLSSDQHNLIFIEMKKIRDSLSNNIKYMIPATKCENEKCKKDIPEVVKDPLDMLFTRHQLVTIANI